MLTTDRRAQILEILRQNGSVTVSKLAEKFETSESTIRRDLLALSQLGKINKVHGGATVLGQEFLHNEEDFNKKSLMNINEKEEIAKYAASQINDDDFVFIDAGTCGQSGPADIPKRPQRCACRCRRSSAEIRHGCPWCR